MASSRVMMSRATAATPWGIDARAVQVEVDVRNGLPQMQLVGLPDAAVRESRERVRAAIKNCGFELPPRVVVVNLAPADLRKEGSHLDLAIALALLSAHGHLPQTALDRRLVCGELGLDGSLRSVRGGLALAECARSLEVDEVLLPTASACQAAALEALPVVAVDSLGEAVQHLLALERREPVTAASAAVGETRDSTDLSEVRGQLLGKRALEVAAAGSHNLLFGGPPGSGKTMLARRLPGLLPPLTTAEALEVTKIHSLVGEDCPEGLMRCRPFRSPHASTSAAGLIGGGSVPRPGEVSLAHHGVLFLDEMPEFRRDVLESLRQPLEDGRVTVVRSRARLTFPSRFSLVGACNPCPCGHYGSLRGPACRCPPTRVESYRCRLSGPLLDRIDLHVEVPAVSLGELREPPGESSAVVAERVLAARERQRHRQGDGVSNAALGSAEVALHCALDRSPRRLLDGAFERLGLSARSVHRVLKVARTLADLAAAERIASAHVAEALQYRQKPVVVE
ncbi:MAG: YifB family Mg chelatase-like AAA ATPase [Acidobacteriota bacterium]